MSYSTRVLQYLSYSTRVLQYLSYSTRVLQYLSPTVPVSYSTCVLQYLCHTVPECLTDLLWCVAGTAADLLLPRRLPGDGRQAARGLGRRHPGQVHGGRETKTETRPSKRGGYGVVRTLARPCVRERESV